jgi:AraC-like DNA-binding protein
MSQKSAIRLRSVDIEALYNLAEWMKQRPQDMFRLNQLCRRAGMNSDKLKKGFLKLFGDSPIRWHRKNKMNEAMRLLLETEETISSIAYMLGFEHPSSFCYCFRKHFGKRPLVVRYSRPIDQPSGITELI